MIQSLLFLHYLTTMTPRNLNNWSPRSNPILKSQYVYTVYYKTQQNFWIWSLSSKSFKVECRDQRLPQWLSCKESACNAGDAILIPELERSSRKVHGNPPQYSCLEDPMDRRTWWATVHKVTKSQTWLKQHSRHAHMDQALRTLGTSLWLMPHQHLSWD